MAQASPAAITGRRLRLGYLSSDFREHSVASFIEPLLRNHDRARFEVYCYSDLPTPDATTQQIRREADAWRDITKLNDAEAARLVREDHIDILFDLAGHTGNNRLGIFAAQPALVQIAYLGYPNTTGLHTVAYRITDTVADPPGKEAYYSERLLHLDGCFLCYQPLSGAPDVAPLPALSNGYVTFGSFNNYSKLNANVLEVWAEVLRQIPGSRLLLKCPALTDEAIRARVLAHFRTLGIEDNRLELLGHTRTRAEHLAVYGRVDIALDTFFYNGTTTTCEALWMGVPVLSLMGRRHAGRVGASLLTTVGLTDWLVDTTEAYVSAARHHAGDFAALGQLRASLRGQVQASMLCDAHAFARRFEAALLRVIEGTGKTRQGAGQVD
jgi:predicted O-linked N-acetylglucosamine transferase (SPINDLY family)